METFTLVFLILSKTKQCESEIKDLAERMRSKKTIRQAGGMGLGFNGGELLLAEILDLITSTDRMAEIPNSLRLGTPVTLRDPQAITTYK
jgi:hypothetical protein